MTDRLSSAQIDSLNRTGYLVVPRNVPYPSLEPARQAADRVVQKCLDITYPHCRADNRLSDSFLEKIENIFSPELFEPELLNVTARSPILTYASQILGTNDLYLAFNRLHVTRTYSAWSSWHRDAEPNGKLDSLKITIPLFHEVGFHVIPGSHEAGNKHLDNGTCDTTIRSHVDGEVRVPVHAGDILIFHTPILHRGTCPGRERYRRAHLHFNFIKMSGKEEYGQVKQDFLTREEILSRVTEDWKVFLKHSIPQHYPITNSHGKSGPGRRLRQYMARAYYYASSLLPESMTQSSPGWLLPFVRCPKELQAMFQGDSGQVSSAR
jgi:ectoine hydroxylase-related dioxygenase (phytanoyl-CoA dioxygenase family)